MTPTEYTRQVPVITFIPAVDDPLNPNRMFGVVAKTTGHKQQRAWYKEHVPDEHLPVRISQFIAKALEQGQEVEGFEWLDEPIWEGNK